MSKHDLIKEFKTTFGYSKNKGRWEVDIMAPTSDKLFRSAANYYYPMGIWSYGLFSDYFSEFLLSWKAKSTLSDVEIIAAIDDIEQKLNRTVSDVFTIVPLPGSTIKNTIILGDTIIVKTGDNTIFNKPRPELDILNEISSITTLPISLLQNHLEFLKREYSPNMLQSPLLIIKRRGQFDELSEINNTTILIREYFLIIRLMAAHYQAGSPILTGTLNEKTKHYFSVDLNKNIHPSPLREEFEVNYKLDFLDAAKAQLEFANLVRIMNVPTDGLNICFLRSIKFFNWSLKGSKHSLDDVSKRILFTLIAAETLLLFSGKGEKKTKLAAVMVGLCNPTDRVKNMNAVIEIYNDRSGLVHAGKQGHYKYIKDFLTDTLPSESLNLAHKMMAEILVKFPDHYFNIKAAVPKNTELLEWEKRLKTHWPVKHRTTIQRLGEWLISNLERLFHL